MAIAVTTFTGSGNNGDSTTYTTSSITPTANALLIAAVVNSHATAVGTVTLAGNGLTWVAIQNIPLNNGVLGRLTVFRAMGASPSAGAVTITISNTATSCAWNVCEFTGVDTSGADGAGAVAASFTAFGTGTAISGSTTAPVAGNAMYGALGSLAGTALTVGAQYTEIGVGSATTPTVRLLTEWDLTGNNGTVDGTTPSAAWGLVGVELQPPGIGQPAMRRLSALSGRHQIGACGRRR